MKEIKIKCRLFDSISNSKYYILIYDDKGHIICQRYTNNEGCLTFYAPYYGVYKIYIFKCGCLMTCTNILVEKKGIDIFNFIFDRKSINNFSLVTFKITDKFYDGLPIKEGKLILWQKSI